jgi:hypothetical protein
MKKIILSLIYKLKWNFDQGVRQVTWITGKLPELMGFVYLSEKMGFFVSKGMIVGIIVTGGLMLLIIGVLVKRTGLYDTEMYVDASKNPVQSEILLAARKINKRFK